MTTLTTLQPVSSKHCPRCGTHKPVAAFQKHPALGLQSWCQVCQVTYTRERRARIRLDTAKYQRYLEQRRDERRRYRARRGARELAALATTEPLPL